VNYNITTHFLRGLFLVNIKFLFNRRVSFLDEAEQAPRLQLFLFFLSLVQVERGRRRGLDGVELFGFLVLLKNQGAALALSH